MQKSELGTGSAARAKGGLRYTSKNSWACYKETLIRLAGSSASSESLLLRALRTDRLKSGQKYYRFYLVSGVTSEHTC